jgi:hypothetical protein
MASFIRFLLVIFALLHPALAEADTWEPDNDESGLNNSFAKAQPIDALRIDSSGKPRGARVAGSLGVVLGNKFDTEDFYKFSIPAGTKWKLEFFMRELPDTTVAIELFDKPGGKWIGRGQGNPTETIIIDLEGGTYYIRLFTSVGSANGREVTYDLAITPVFVPIPGTPGPDCANAADLSADPNKRRVTGTLSPANTTASYSFYLTQGAQFQVSRLNSLRNYEVHLIERTVRNRFWVARKAEPEGSIMLLLDPGYYCLQMSNTQLSAPANYDVDLSIVFAGWRPSSTRAGALAVTSLNLGNLSENGKYKNSRYAVYPAPNSVLASGTEYRLREWIGISAPEQWYQFMLTESGSLHVALRRLHRPAGFEVLDSAGRTLMVGQPSGSPLMDYLPEVTGDSKIGPGMYYLRMSALGTSGPGTGYDAAVFFVASK